MIEQCIYFIITEKQAHYSEACVELISSGATCWLVACFSLLLFFENRFRVLEMLNTESVFSF